MLSSPQVKNSVTVLISNILQEEIIREDIEEQMKSIIKDKPLLKETVDPCYAFKPLDLLHEKQKTFEPVKFKIEPKKVFKMSEKPFFLKENTENLKIASNTSCTREDCDSFCSSNQVIFYEHKPGPYISETTIDQMKTIFKREQDFEKENRAIRGSPQHLEDLDASMSVFLSHSTNCATSAHEKRHEPRKQRYVSEDSAFCDDHLDYVTWNYLENEKDSTSKMNNPIQSTHL